MRHSPVYAAWRRILLLDRRIDNVSDCMWDMADDLRVIRRGGVVIQAEPLWYPTRAIMEHLVAARNTGLERHTWAAWRKRHTRNP